MILNRNTLINKIIDFNHLNDEQINQLLNPDELIEYSNKVILDIVQRF